MDEHYGEFVPLEMNPEFIDVPIVPIADRVQVTSYILSIIFIILAIILLIRSKFVNKKSIRIISILMFILALFTISLAIMAGWKTAPIEYVP